MRKRYKNSFRNKLLDRVNALSGNVVLWEDLNDLGGSRQISRALKDCIEDGSLARIGRGVYAKTKISKYIDQPVIREGFEEACVEALKRLNIGWELGQAIKDYNDGLSQQVPAQFQIRLKNRLRRTFSYGESRIKFEGGINAR